MKPEIPIPAYILSGGKSSRMGADKGLLEYKGKPVIAHIIDVVHPLTSRLFLLSSNPDHRSFGIEMVPDLFPETGPAGAIAGMLNHMTPGHALIIPCDMPLIHSRSVTGLIHHAKPGEITIPVHHGRIYPLFGIYPKTCAERWNQLVKTGQYKVRVLLSDFKVRYLETDQLPDFDPDPFFNLNTPEDYKTLTSQ